MTAASSFGRLGLLRPDLPESFGAKSAPISDPRFGAQILSRVRSLSASESQDATDEPLDPVTDWQLAASTRPDGNPAPFSPPAAQLLVLSQDGLLVRSFDDLSSALRFQRARSGFAIVVSEAGVLLAMPPRRGAEAVAREAIGRWRERQMPEEPASCVRLKTSEAGASPQAMASTERHSAGGNRVQPTPAGAPSEPVLISKAERGDTGTGAAGTVDDPREEKRTPGSGAKASAGDSSASPRRAAS